MKRKWEYKVSVISPTGQDTPIASSIDWQRWLNKNDEQGWEYLGPMYRFWYDRDIPQQYYVFRRPYREEE